MQAAGLLQVMPPAFKTALLQPQCAIRYNRGKLKLKRCRLARDRFVQLLNIAVVTLVLLANVKLVFKTLACHDTNPQLHAHSQDWP